MMPEAIPVEDRPVKDLSYYLLVAVAVVGFGLAIWALTPWFPWA